MVTERMQETFDGTKLYVKKNDVEHPKAVVVIVHGLCEHQGRYDYVTERFNQQGFRVYRFDHRGHGRSEGKKVFYSCYDEIIEDVNGVVDMALAESEGLPVFVLGHSMGGYATACFGTKYPGKVKGFVLSGALTRYNNRVAGDIAPEIPNDQYVPNALGGGVCSDPAVVLAYENDPLVEKEIAIGLFRTIEAGVDWLKANPDRFTDPVFLLHGCCDGLVSERDSREFFGEIASEDKSLKIYAKLYHEILNEPCRDAVIHEIVHWIAERID